MEDLLGISGLNLEEKALRIRKLKRKTPIILGRTFTEAKEDLNDYTEFKKWSCKTGYNASTVCRQMQKSRLYYLLIEERGKKTVEELSLILVSSIFKLERCNKEKFLELINLIENGLCRLGIEEYLTVNYTEESTTMKGEELAEHFEDINNDIKQIDIRALKESTGKKILRAMERLKKLISECTKLNIAKSRQSIRSKIEQINYNSNILNLN